MAQIIKPGIYFDLPFDEYLAIPALSNSGIKKLLISSLDFWTHSWMNPNPPKDKEAKHFLDGRAYHARILEGEDAFNSRYAPAFDASEYPEALDTNDELKDCLRAAKDAGHDVKLTGKKEFLIEQILDIDPNRQILEVLKKEYARQCQGREFIDLDTMNQIAFASAMIEKHPDISKCFQGGYPEVTIVWYETVLPDHQSPDDFKVLMKARLDYLKIKAIVDLKTFANMHGKPIDRAIYGDISQNKYHIQTAVYFRAVSKAKEFVHSGDTWQCGPAFDTTAITPLNDEHKQKWLEKFAMSNDLQFVFVHQQKGPAPVARANVMPRDNVYACGQHAVREAQEKFVRNVELYGMDGTPWVDVEPIGRLDDEGFPAWIAEY
jgi:hypothetical protein